MAALAVACGPPAAPVAGLYSGHHDLVVGGGGGEAGAEVINVGQTGGEIRFTLGLCSVKAFADGERSFRVVDFRCNRIVSNQTWELIGEDGRSKVTSNANNLSVSLAGVAKGSVSSSTFTWSFNGSRSF